MDTRRALVGPRVTGIVAPAARPLPFLGQPRARAAGIDVQGVTPVWLSHKRPDMGAALIGWATSRGESGTL